MRQIRAYQSGVLYDLCDDLHPLVTVFVVVGPRVDFHAPSGRQQPVDRYHRLSKRAQFRTHRLTLLVWDMRSMQSNAVCGGLWLRRTKRVVEVAYVSCRTLQRGSASDTVKAPQGSQVARVGQIYNLIDGYRLAANPSRSNS